MHYSACLEARLRDHLAYCTCERLREAGWLAAHGAHAWVGDAELSSPAPAAVAAVAVAVARRWPTRRVRGVPVCPMPPRPVHPPLARPAGRLP